MNFQKLFFNRENALALIALGMLGLVLSAFVLEYGFDAKPCQMCWWQRYVHWVIGATALTGWFLRQKIKPLFSLGTLYFLSLVGATIAIWQMLVQRKIVPAPEGCSGGDVEAAQNAASLLANLKGGTVDVMPPCDQIDFTILTFSLADWNFLVMLCLAVYITIVLRRTS